jgi:hypothetical protein
MTFLSKFTKTVADFTLIEKSWPQLSDGMNHSKLKRKLKNMHSTLENLIEEQNVALSKKFYNP